LIRNLILAFKNKILGLEFINKKQVFNMSLFDLISMALKNLFKRKLRSLLTIFGVVIGTASIVIMLSLGLALNKNFDEQLKNLADINLIYVYKDISSDIKLDDNALFKLKNLDGIESASPILNLDLVRAVSKKYIANLSLVGLEPEFLKNLGYKLKSGRFLESQDKLNIVCGYDIQYRFYKKSANGFKYKNYDEEPFIDIMKDKINISVDETYGDQESKSNGKIYLVKFVGMLEKSESYSKSDHNCYMNIDQVKKLKLEKNKLQKINNKQDFYDEIDLKCKNIKHVKEIAEKIKSMGYTVYYAGEYLESMKKMSRNIELLLGAIGAVSLLVAAIGITNTMIMSVYERTREIGIMKVIGASVRDIKKLFLLEAITIGFLGGVFGVLISLILSGLLNKISVLFSDLKLSVSYVPIWLCLIAISFSSLIGLISGYLPAHRATKLSAIKAIKSEI